MSAKIAGGDPRDASARSRLDTIIADMQMASDAVDEANGTSDYQMRLMALAMIARHYLRERLAAGEAGSSVPRPAPLEDWIERIEQWRENETAGYDKAVDLLCEIQTEMLRHLKRSAAGDAVLTRPQEPKQLRHLASAMKKLLPAPLLAEVLGHIDPLGEFERFLAAFEAGGAREAPSR